MEINSFFRNPVLRQEVETVKTEGGIELRYLNGRRFIEFEFGQDRRDLFYNFVDVLSSGKFSADELKAVSW